MAESRSIEVKVGMLILIGLALLAALVLVMGRITFQKRFALYVDFENPGAIQPGAAVKIAGVRVGSVESLEFRASVLGHICPLGRSDGAVGHSRIEHPSPPAWRQ